MNWKFCVQNTFFIIVTTYFSFDYIPFRKRVDKEVAHKKIFFPWETVETTVMQSLIYLKYPTFETESEKKIRVKQIFCYFKNKKK